MASNDLTLTCRWCGPRERVFKGADCIEQFMHYVFNDEKLLKFASLTLCAHNASGFDNIPILDFLTQRPCFAKSSPSIIMRGTRIVEIKMGRVRMVDSLNYLSMKLSALPKALGLGVDVKKGWFPHHFSQHSGYVGPIPPKEMYGVDKMSVAERAEFEAWYATQQDVVFDLDRELLEYCRMDVTILRLACLRFRELYLAVASVDPFRECCTLASCCMLTYRANYLNPSTIALLPECGYFGVDRQSKVALEWLQWYSHEHNIELQHAGNGREVKVGRFRVDGMNADQKLVLEFLGCWWHGCRACFSARTAVIGHEKKNNEDTMDARLKRTQERRELLEAQGYTVVSMWECEWKRQKQMDAEVSAFVEAHPVALEDPLDPREAFYGGRTNNTKLYCAAGPDEMICYADICSLYPYVNKTGLYPLGKPRRVLADFPHPKDFHGFIKCVVLPPQNLYHPILPLKLHNKLMFVLCYACAVECLFERPEGCPHTPEQRQLKGTWVAEEVSYALENGYTLVQTLEVWVYDRWTRYDPTNKDPLCEEKLGIFAGYVNAFLKLKLEASGWPAECDTDEKKKAYLEAQAANGVMLDANCMEYNPGKRTLSKLQLNSLWGKFGQKPNLTKHVMVTAVDKHYDLLMDEALQVNSILPINEYTELVSYEAREGAVPTSPNTNVVIAAYTTAQARIILHRYLATLGQNATYYDTDSVTFKQGLNDPPLIQYGTDLGQMTNELEAFGPGSYITEFVSGGPKVYGLKIAKGGNRDDVAYVVKVKGVSQNSSNTNLITFENLKKLVLGEIESIRIESKKDIRRDGRFHILSKDTHKILKPVYTKRQRHPRSHEEMYKYDTIPYGYKEG
ncbi:uncharacterized protein LOC127749286 [Frankliniella occidentalis]|uniref:DNA-directed DNA polymerase n=1 Tax=Frankliniella occidentalis TaxID=133901 RepID=A0A9C6U333_FRAOC|nr:uncharacterized protein LOC127749286 [Frankliniella occidentalis]